MSLSVSGVLYIVHSWDGNANVVDTVTPEKPKLDEDDYFDDEYEEVRLSLTVLPGLFRGCMGR